MSHAQKPGDPADKGLDAFVSHRAGYGHDKLARLVDYLRRQPRATLASGEGAVLLAEIDRLQGEYDIVVSMLSNQIPLLNRLLEEKDGLRAEIDRLRDDLHTQDGWVQWAKGEMDRMHAAAKHSMDHYTDARAEVDRLRDQLYLADQSARSSSAEAARLRAILAALREPSEKVVDAVHGIQLREEWYARAELHAAIIRAAVAAAEQEVGRE